MKPGDKKRSVALLRMPYKQFNFYWTQVRAQKAVVKSWRRIHDNNIAVTTVLHIFCGHLKTVIW